MGFLSQVRNREVRNAELRLVDSALRIRTPHSHARAMLPPPFMWQFLNFLPLPQGQGSLRPTRWPRLRIGSSGRSPCWLAPMAACCCWAISLCVGISSWMAALSTQVEPTKSSSSCSMLEDQVGRPLADAGPHLLERAHAFALVLHLGIDLGIAAQADAGPQVVHRQQVVLPGGVEDLQQHAPAPCGGSPAGSGPRRRWRAAAPAARGPARPAPRGDALIVDLLPQPIGQRFPARRWRRGSRGQARRGPPGGRTASRSAGATSASVSLAFC